MAKKVLYKNTILVEVLSESPVDLSGLSLTQIDHEITDGEWSGRSHEKTVNRKLVGKAAAMEVRVHGSDPEFFRMDEQGNEIED